MNILWTVVRICGKNGAMSEPKDLVLTTDRLILRQWRPEDLQPFSAMNADPRVMEFFPSVMSVSETEAMMKRIDERVSKNGYCFWAAELKETAEFIGFSGLNIIGFEAHFTPGVEIGWRLAHPFWGKGYAPEGAQAALEYGFRKLGLHPMIPDSHPLKKHVLYRASGSR